MTKTAYISRRALLKSLISTAGLVGLPLPASVLAAGPYLTKKIPKTGEAIPVIGMGSSITFNVGDDVELRNERTKVLNAFFNMGGGMIDSSPMYGSSEAVIGHGLRALKQTPNLFSATKVWTPFTGSGVKQIKHSTDLWGVQKFDLLQIHNLVNWRAHLETLQEMKQQGAVRYIGITTSHGRRHGDFEEIMKTEDIDFVQFSYNIQDRDAERRLLPVALERNLAVIINRPFQRGSLFSQFASQPLPNWAREIDCQNWAQFLLKFIVSHEAVTCAIPATSQVAHMQENMGAALGRLPDQTMRQRMIDYCDSL